MDIDTGSALPDGDVPHTVRFYADDAALMAEAAGFIDTALAAGGAGIVIATQAHCADVRRLLANPGHVRFLDAEQALAGLLLDGWPDEARFRAAVVPLLDAAAASAGPVHVFGEMAALLCAQGRYQAALRIEQLSNGLGVDYCFAQFCAYPWRLFPDAAQAQVFEDICAEHGRACGSTVHGADHDLRGRSLAGAHREQKAVAPGGEAPWQAGRMPVPRDCEAGRAGDVAAGLHRVGPDGTILWADRAELQMLGYRWEEYVGRHIAHFHVDAELVDLILDTMLSGGVLVDQPVRLRCKNGAIRHVQMNSSNFFEGGRLRYSDCITRDDTERNDIAAASAQRDSMLLNAPVAVALLMAPDLRFRLANRHFCELFGQRELVGKRLVEALPQLRHGRFEAALEHVFESGQPYCEEALALVLSDAGGMPLERFFKINLEALYNDGGERHGVMAVALDVTHARKRRAGGTQGPSVRYTAGRARRPETDAQ